MIRTVLDLKRALEAFPDDAPAQDALYAMLDTLVDQYETIIPLKLKPEFAAEMDQAILDIEAGKTIRHNSDEETWAYLNKMNGSDYPFPDDIENTLIEALDDLANGRFTTITGMTPEERRRALWGDDDA